MVKNLLETYLNSPQYDFNGLLLVCEKVCELKFCDTYVGKRSTQSYSKLDTGIFEKKERSLPWINDGCQIAPGYDADDYTGNPFCPDQPYVDVDPVCPVPTGPALSITFDSAP